MLPKGLQLCLCTTGILQLSASGILDSVSQLVSNGKSFYRVAEVLSWQEAKYFCRRYYTDLADLESLNSEEGIKTLYKLTSKTEAWVGLFYNEKISGLSWSSGSVFTNPEWCTLPVFQRDLCATLFSTVYILPALGAASCIAQKPFICYEDHSVGHSTSSESSLSLTVLPKQAEVQIGRLNFIRFQQEMTWPLALKYCRNHYTDLADLQTVTDEADKKALKTITNKIEAWIGLYFNTKSENLTWSSDLGDSIPDWLLPVPMLRRGLCAALGNYLESTHIYAVGCSLMKSFICFYDPNTGTRKLAEMPPFLDASSVMTVKTTPKPTRETSTVSAAAFPSLVSKACPQQTMNLGSTTLSSNTCNSTTFTSVGLPALQYQGSTSLSPLTIHAPLGGTAVQREQLRTLAVPAQAASLNLLPGEEAVTSVKDAIDTREKITATQAQHLSSSNHPESEDQTGTPKTGYSFGILKADFTISTLKDPAELKDEFLKEF
ncbi:putative C-type lectin domain family 20 member A isoform 2-T3 [Thomomys bottae]